MDFNFDFLCIFRKLWGKETEIQAFVFENKIKISLLLLELNKQRFFSYFSNSEWFHSFSPIFIAIENKLNEFKFLSKELWILKLESIQVSIQLEKIIERENRFEERVSFFKFHLIKHFPIPSLLRLENCNILKLNIFRKLNENHQMKIEHQWEETENAIFLFSSSVLIQIMEIGSASGIVFWICKRTKK